MTNDEQQQHDRPIRAVFLAYRSLTASLAAIREARSAILAGGHEDEDARGIVTTLDGIAGQLEVQIAGIESQFCRLPQRTGGLTIQRVAGGAWAMYPRIDEPA